MLSGPPSDGDNLRGMEMDAWFELDRSEMLDEVTVRTDDRERLIVGTAVSAAPADDVAQELRSLWLANIAYRFAEAHVVTVEEGRVVLSAVTQAGPGELWVTFDVAVTVGGGAG